MVNQPSAARRRVERYHGPRGAINARAPTPHLERRSPQAVSPAFDGSSHEAMSPIHANTPSTTTASPYSRLPASCATMIVPAIATPSDDPRFETLRDSPEIPP